MRRISTAVLVAFSLVLALPAVAASGDLDPTFSTDGKDTFDLVTWQESPLRAAARGPGGTILVAGPVTGDFGVARLLSEGGWDATFAGGGVKTVDFSSSGDTPAWIGRDSSGRVVVVGHATSGGTSRIAILRLTASGTPDATFGGGGETSTLIGPNGCVGYAGAVDSKGRILAAGRKVQANINYADALFVRYKPNGAVDLNFGTAGVTTPPVKGVEEEILGMTLDGSEKIVGVGSWHDDTLARTNQLIVRLTKGGLPDDSFSGDGVLPLPAWPGTGNSDTSAGGELTSVAVDDQGRIVAAGWYRQYNVTYMTVVRVLPSGKMDTSFDSDGRVIFLADGQEAMASWVGIDEKGRIVLAGSTDVSPHDTAIARIKPNGAPDANFKGDGTLKISLAGDDQVKDAYLDARGRLVVAGNAGTQSLVARFRMG